MIKDNLSKGKDFGKFEYYRIGNTPVRLVLDKEGRMLGTNGLNKETGELVFGAYIKAIMTDPFSKEITEEEFYTLFEELVIKNKDIRLKLN